MVTAATCCVSETAPRSRTDCGCADRRPFAGHNHQTLLAKEGTNTRQWGEIHTCALNLSPPPSTSTSTSLRRHSQIDACQGSWEGHPLVQSFLLPSKFRLNITSFNAFGKEIQTCLHIVLISNVTSR